MNTMRKVGNDMRASVVMATYNGAAYLREQIDSIVQAMDADDELVIADDGSDDGTIAILEQYSARDPRVKVLPNRSHKGVIGNFDYGIRRANGDIILLADQDDVWFPNKISRLKQLFASDPNLTCVLSDLTIIDGDGNETAPSFFAWRGVQPGYWKNFMKNSFIGNAMTFRSTIKPYILPIPPKVPMHDQWIGLINERYGKVLFLHDALGSYRRHGHNVTDMQHGSISSMLRKRWNLAKELHARSRRINLQSKRGELQ